MHHHRAFRPVIGLALAAVVSVALIAQSQEPPPKPAGRQFRFLGPAVGNRAAAIAGIPGDPRVYYLGAASGGVWKTVDTGLNWTHMGLDETGRIARVIVHPRNPDIGFVCAVGRASGPQPERGVFRTTDGGLQVGSGMIGRQVLSL